LLAFVISARHDFQMAGVNGYGGRQRRDEEPENNPVTGQIGNESITDRNRRVFGKAAPDGESVKAFEQGLRNNQISREAEAAGQSGETAVASTGTGLDSWGPNGPKTLGLNRLPQAKSPMGGGGETAGETVSFKSSGEEYMYKAKNAIRALQGLPPVAQELNPRDKFQVDVEKSISFGDKSGLLTPTGHVKAFESGIRAGYSTDEVNGMLQGARDRLKPKGDAEVLSNARGPSAQATPSNTTGVLLPQATEGTEANTIGVLAPKDTPLRTTMEDRNSEYNPALNGLTAGGYNTMEKRNADVIDPRVTAGSPLEGDSRYPTRSSMAGRIESAFGQTGGALGETRNIARTPDATPNSPTIDASFTPAESEDDKKKSISERYKILTKDKDYTPAQAADILGLKDGKAPEGFEGTGLGALIKSLNSYR